MKGEVRQQIRKFSLVADHLHLLRHAKDRFQQSESNLLWQKVWNSHRENQTAAGLLPFQSLHQFLTRGKNFFRVVKNHFSGFCQSQISAMPFVQFAAHRLLQLAQLSTDGGLRQMQRVGGLADAAFTSHRPEIQQMVIIQPVHVQAPFLSKAGRDRRSIADYSSMQQSISNECRLLREESTVSGHNPTKRRIERRVSPDRSPLNPAHTSLQLRRDFVLSQ